MAQSVERLTLDFDSGHDLRVPEFEPLIGLCADSSQCEALLRILSLTLPCLCTLAAVFTEKMPRLSCRLFARLGTERVVC